jgi:hypothetical protein
VQNNQHGISDTVFEMTALEGDLQCVKDMTAMPHVLLDQWIAKLDIEQLEKLKHAADRYTNHMWSDTAIRAFADLHPDMVKSQDLEEYDYGFLLSNI